MPLVRPFMTPIVLILAALPVIAVAVDAMPPVPEGSTAVDERSAAEADADVGRKSLLAYRKNQPADPQLVIDAAIAFAEAHKRYTVLGDADAVAEMQANIYWCKKQMNLDTVREYLARKGKVEALVQVDAVAEQTVDASEAQPYFDRAKKFAVEHPQDLAGISVRYFEVATRFVGTPIGLESQRLSLDAQNLYMRRIQDGGALRETLFTRPTAVVNGSRLPVPDERQVKGVIANLKTLYADGYAGKSDAQRRRFAGKLMTEAARSTNDSATYYALLNEAVRIAQESEDYEKLLDSVDLLAAAFAQVDGATEKKAWLRKIPGKPTAAAISLLLDKPTDPAANAVTGRFFCFQLQRWKEGLAMLALSGDPALKAVAEQELSNPVDDGQRSQIGAAWLAIAKKSASTRDRTACMQRAKHWYLQVHAAPGVAGESLQQRLQEIEKALPLDTEAVDWKSLTPLQWEKIKGQVRIVQVRADRSGPVASLKAGELLRIVPHPTDTWLCQGLNGKITTNWSGTPMGDQNGGAVITFSLPSSRFRFGELLCQIGKGDLQECGVIAGPGPLWLVPNRASGENKGEIRFKLVPVEDEE